MGRELFCPRTPLMSEAPFLPWEEGCLLQSRDRNLVDSASSIRLSQRLSHACLSINDFIRETANGSLYQL